MEYHKKRYGNNSKNMRKIKIAFIGAGNMTTEHIKCFYDENSDNYNATRKVMSR